MSSVQNKTSSPRKKKRTWNMKITPLKRKNIFQTFQFQVFQFWFSGVFHVFFWYFKIRLDQTCVLRPSGHEMIFEDSWFKSGWGDGIYIYILYFFVVCLLFFVPRAFFGCSVNIVVWKENQECMKTSYTKVPDFDYNDYTPSFLLIGNLIYMSQLENVCHQLNHGGPF